IERTPELSSMGLSLFATHTTVLWGTWLYQMPIYLYFELPGVKNPRAKTFPSETIKLPSSLTEWFGVMVSMETVKPKSKQRSSTLINHFPESMTCGRLGGNLEIKVFV
ncbi:hypothetical protein SLEP1_g60466, partial [Rubroshorea leprosula]